MLADARSASRRSSTPAQKGGKKVSLADLIVLGGCAAVEAAAKKGGHDVKVPFTPGRMDASLEQTDVNSFEVLEPAADGFRNYVRPGAEDVTADGADRQGQPAHADRAGDDGAASAACARSTPTPGTPPHGVFTKRPGTLSNDFFVNLLDMRTAWKRSEKDAGRVRGPRPQDRRAASWTATVADLVFGSNSQLRALAEVYAASDGAGELRARLRGRLDQGDGPGPLRPAVTDDAPALAGTVSLDLVTGMVSGRG